MGGPSGIEQQRQLVNALTHLGTAASVEVIETHISWVVLIGEYAYKIKKAINLGFLDYSTLELRHRFCQEELRLNSRTAPDIYLGVVTITGSSTHTVIEGEGETIEWAVKMRRFDQEQLASCMAQQNRLTRLHIDRLAHNVADFHRRIAAADASSRFGTFDSVCEPVEENFHQIRTLIDATECLSLLTLLNVWYRVVITSLKPLLELRKQENFIRECHGDLHLGNIVVIDDEPLPFDGIEFNDNLRFIDVVSEIAFLLMDLDHRQRSDLGWRFLDGYLQESGDFSGLALLRFYQVYRAMVRAKVAAIRASQKGIEGNERHAQLSDIFGHLQLALGYTRPASPQLIITHGFSGSGKSSVAQQLLEQWGAVRLRSDVERKRLFGLAAAERSESQVAQGLYTADASAQTYARLAHLSGVLLDAGFNVIVDATFLRRTDRQQFIELAESRNVRWHLLDVTASESVMRERIAVRHAGHSDASEADLAVLEHQLHNHDPITASESPHIITLNTDNEWNVAGVLAVLH